MQSQDAREAALSVLVSLVEEGEGCRIVLDDAQCIDRDNALWKTRAHFTNKAYARQALQEMLENDAELAALGLSVLVRVMACHPGLRGAL